MPFSTIKIGRSDRATASVCGWCAWSWSRVILGARSAGSPSSANFTCVQQNKAVATNVHVDSVDSYLRFSVVSSNTVWAKQPVARKCFALLKQATPCSPRRSVAAPRCLVTMPSQKSISCDAVPNATSRLSFFRKVSVMARPFYSIIKA